MGTKQFLTKRDRRLLDFVHRYRLATHELFGGAFFPGPNQETTVARVVRKLVRRGFLRKVEYAACQSYVALTRRGSRAIGAAYRESYGMFVCNGILFNHESPRRGETFVSRKITRAAARIAAGLQENLFLGNLDAQRDWGYAKEYVEAMWLMLQQDEPDDYVIASGETHSVRELVETAFSHADLDWLDHVLIDEKLYRPAEVNELRGDFGKARAKLGWKPTITFRQLIPMMVDADLTELRRRAGKE